MSQRFAAFAMSLPLYLQLSVDVSPFQEAILEKVLEHPSFIFLEILFQFSFGFLIAEAVIGGSSMHYLLFYQKPLSECRRNIFFPDSYQSGSLHLQDSPPLCSFLYFQVLDMLDLLCCNSCIDYKSWGAGRQFNFCIKSCF